VPHHHHHGHGHHHRSPLDPRTPLGSYIWFNILTGDDNGPRRGGGRGTPGCGCTLLTVIAVAFFLLIISGLTK
jgi:hypothetical protein